MSLLCQLWSLHEAIQEYKGSSLLSEASFSADNGYSEEEEEEEDEVEAEDEEEKGVLSQPPSSSSLPLPSSNSRDQWIKDSFHIPWYFILFYLMEDTGTWSMHFALWRRRHDFNFSLAFNAILSCLDNISRYSISTLFLLFTKLVLVWFWLHFSTKNHFILQIHWCDWKCFGGAYNILCDILYVAYANASICTLKIFLFRFNVSLLVTGYTW